MQLHLPRKVGGGEAISPLVSSTSSQSQRTHSYNSLDERTIPDNRRERLWAVRHSNHASQEQRICQQPTSCNIFSVDRQKGSKWIKTKNPPTQCSASLPIGMPWETRRETYLSRVEETFNQPSSGDQIYSPSLGSLQ